MNVREILTTLKNAADDLTTLDVVTLTGNISISSSVEEEKINLKKLYQEITSNASQEDTDLEVVAFTHIDFDCDSVNFVKTGASEGEAALLNAHNAMVKTAQETRQSVISMIKETIGL